MYKNVEKPKRSSTFDGCERKDNWFGRQKVHETNIVLYIIRYKHHLWQRH